MLGPVFLVENASPTSTIRKVAINFTATTDFNLQFENSVSFSNVNAKDFAYGFPQLAQTNKFEITGQLIINNTSTVSSVVNTVVFNGSIIGVDSSGSTKMHYLWFDNAYIVPEVNATQSIVSARDSAFINPVTMLTYKTISGCYFENGMTVAQAPGSVGNAPSGLGIYATSLKGTYSGPFPDINGNQAFLLDSSSYYWFQTNGATLSGGATIQALVYP